MKKYSLLIPLALAAYMFAPVRADDLDIFMSGPDVEPNVVILFDNSGSMSSNIGGKSKIAIAKEVVTNLIATVDGVRFGVFTFNDTNTGGKLVAEVGSDSADMIAAVNALTASGNTPLGRALADGQLYYYGRYEEEVTCPRSGRGDRGSGRRGRGGDDDDDDDDDTCTVTFASPIQHKCQLNYVILMTDGMPTQEDTNLVAQTATRLFTRDHSPLEDMQNVIVHTIGFDVPEGTTLLRQTATNGGGTFHTATSYNTLLDALQNTLTSVFADQYIFSTPLIPTTSAGDGAKAYLATFQPDPSRPFWRGYLSAYTRGSNGLVPTDADGMPLASAKVWDAGTLLAARAASGRTIKTVVSGTLQDFTVANGNVTMGLLGVPAPLRAKVIDFVRGIDTYDVDGDGNVTEERAWKLGDIIHSDPVLVYPPPLLGGDADYKAFRTANASRASIVLIGANDGMLHAFRASDGVELWAFIPPVLLSKLKNMTGAVGAHDFFVDSSPVVADVKIGGTWKTIAVFGLRRGGNYYYALDITNTTSPAYLWSYTDSEMGETWSEPAIGRVKMDDDTVKFVGFVGGGFQTSANNTKGRSFYAIDLANGSLLWKYATGGSADKRYMNYSLPAPPTAADLDGDGYIDRVYASDIGGQIWKFDTSAPATLTGGLIDNWTGKRLFVADTRERNPPAAGMFSPAQGMYASPVLAFDHAGDLWVFLGTGDRNNPRDPSDNRIYAIKDDTSMTNGAALDESDLVDTKSGDEVTQGWYLNLAPDEKVWMPAEVYNQIVYVSSYTPTTTGDCDAGSGFSRLYAFQMGNGHIGLNWRTGDSMNGTDGSEGRSIAVGNGAPSKPSIVLGTANDGVTVGTTDGEVTNVELPHTARKRLRYWREVF